MVLTIGSVLAGPVGRLRLRSNLVPGTTLFSLFLLFSSLEAAQCNSCDVAFLIVVRSGDAKWPARNVTI
jgi:hypothetical protein